MEIKIFTKRAINDDYEHGTAYKNPDGSYRISGVETKPNGSNSNYISIGKFIQKYDEFGDIVSEWHHYGYPKGFTMEGFKFKSDWNGTGACTRINWTFILPPHFLKEDYAIAIIGTGQGGKGYRSKNIDVIFDCDRDNVVVA